MRLIPSIVAVLFVGIVASSSSVQATSFETGGVDPPAVPIPPAAQVVQRASACPSDMVEVEGDYCPDVENKTRCLFNVDMNGKVQKDASGHVMQDMTWACGQYQSPSVCEPSHLVHMHFCIDKYEWPNKEGQVPQDWMTWHDAKKAVESVGKRLCTHREWTLAAEGPHMHPLPYGDGFHRDSSICNFDNDVKMDVASESKRPDDEASKKLRALLVPSGSKPNCVSEYGVHDMAGNIDEWVVNESSNDLCENKSSGNCRSGLMGGHIWHVRNNSFSMTTAHGAGFGWYETGTRACKDIK